MQIGIPKESQPGETRVAATPDSVKKLIKKGLKVVVQSGAGEAAGFPDALYTAEGAEVVSADRAWGSEIIFKILKPTQPEIGLMKKGSLLISLLEPYSKDGTIEKLAEQGVDAMALELVPRSTRGQAMDVLSSQAGIAGYRAVVESAIQYKRFFPMMMTSAGSAKPAKVVILGAGVAGLQAIATARKMGAQVEAYDVRPEVKEQILSLGAKFIDIDVGESGSGTGGYAKELSETAKKKQQELLGERLKKADVIITTANIPGRKSPTLVVEDVVKGMRPGSVIIDMAAANGGNCPLTEAGKIVVKHGVTLVGITNYAALVPTDSSSFFSNNLVNTVSLMVETKDGKTSLNINLEDDILKAILIVQNGKLCRQL